MSGRRFLCAAVCMLTLAAADAASAATYAGRAVDDPKTRVEFQKAGGEIRGFEVHRAKFRCPRDPPFRDPDSAILGTMRLRNDDTFEGEFFNSEEDTGAMARGKVEGGFANGVFRIDIVPRDGEFCTTDIVKWRARRV